MHIRSQSGAPEACILDCETMPGGEEHRGLTLTHDEELLLEQVTIRNGYTVIAADESVAIDFYSPNASAEMACCDLWGNAGGDWVGPIEAFLGADGNISADPLFCDPLLLDFTLHAGSPCAPFTPPNETCDLIGAWPVGCAPTPAQSATWGRMKTLFR